MKQKKKISKLEGKRSRIHPIRGTTTESNEKSKDSFRDFRIIKWSNYFHYRDPRRREETDKVEEISS